MSDDQKPGVVGVATGGIQDVSALLPLLGTEQCERLVTSALQQGLLYAAATPMSIFGSLGIVKAGFVVLWASIDHRLFPGPTLLRNAGFTPCGMGELLVHVAEGNRHLYVAEDKLRRHLSKMRIRSVKINLLSKDLWFWNLRLVGITAFLSSLGLLPYIYLIVRFLSDDPFQTTWLYPVIRVVGCGMVAISIQFIFQLRVLEEAYCRIRFLATDNYLKDHGRSVPEFWDPNERSKNVLSQLRNENDARNPSPGDKPKESAPAEQQAARKGKVRAPSRSVSIDDVTRNNIIRDLGKISSFSFPVFGDSPPSAPLTMPVPAVPPTGAPPQPPENSSAAEKGESTGVVEAEQRKARLPFHVSFPWLSRPTNLSTAVLLWITQASLLFGLGLSVVGYIGCFSVVQASPRGNSRGPLVWLICEALLAIARTLVWAWNPTWDDPKSPIALEKIALSPDGTVEAAKTKKSSYGIGWMLDSVTANDMHALIVGINDFEVFPSLTECVDDARKVAEYLQDTLLVPRGQIVTLINSEATKDRIIEELKALAHKASVVDGAPIVIYFATHSFVESSTKSTYLVPYIDDPGLKSANDINAIDLKRYTLAYSAIVDILKHLSEEKTSNTTLVLDSCHAGAMGFNEKFSTQPSWPGGPKRFSPREGGRGMGAPDEDGMDESHEVASAPKKNRGMVMGRITKKTTEILVGHPSHILLAGTGTEDVAYEDRGKGGLFTRTLLEVLTETEEPGSLEKMTYKKLVEKINEKIKESNRRQEALCTTIYQNRLLFNGLFARKLNAESSMPVITVQYSDDS